MRADLIHYSWDDVPTRSLSSHSRKMPMSFGHGGNRSSPSPRVLKHGGGDDEIASKSSAKQSKAMLTQLTHHGVLPPATSWTHQPTDCSHHHRRSDTNNQVPSRNPWWNKNVRSRSMVKKWKWCGRRAKELHKYTSPTTQCGTFLRALTFGQSRKKREWVTRFCLVVVWRKWHTFVVRIDVRAIRWRRYGMVPMMAMVCGDVCVRGTWCQSAARCVWADLQLLYIKKWVCTVVWSIWIKQRSPSSRRMIDTLWLDY